MEETYQVGDIVYIPPEETLKKISKFINLRFLQEAANKEAEIIYVDKDYATIKILNADKTWIIENKRWGQYIQKKTIIPEIDIGELLK